MSNINPASLRALQQENARLKEENRELQDEIRYLRLAIRALNELEEELNNLSDDDVFSVIENIMAYAQHAVNAVSGSLLLLDSDTSELVFVAVSGSEVDLVGYRIPASAGIAGHVVSNRVPMLVQDVRKEPKWFPGVDHAIGFQTRSLMCVPVVDNERVFGALELINKQNDMLFDANDLDILRLVARFAAILLVRAEQMS